MKPVPNWKKVPCSRCNAQPGHACFMEDGVFNLIHSERRQFADQQFGAYLPSIGGRTPRKITSAMRYWSDACRTGHPDRCKGRRRAIHGERGWKSCENPEHQVTTEMVT